MKLLGTLGENQCRVKRRLHPLIFTRWLVERRDHDRIGVDLLNGPVRPIGGVANIRHGPLNFRTAADQDVGDLAGDLVDLVEDAVGAGPRYFHAVEHAFDLGAVLGDDVVGRAEQVAGRRHASA